MKYPLYVVALCSGIMAAPAVYAASPAPLPKPAVGCDQWHMGDNERQQCYKEWNAAKSESDRLAVEHKYNHAAKIPASARPAAPDTNVEAGVAQEGPIAPPSKRPTSTTIPKVNNRAASGNHTE